MNGERLRNQQLTILAQAKPAHGEINDVTKPADLSPASLSILRSDLERHEGFRGHVYKDSVGKYTIGIGRNVHADGPGITKAEAYHLLDNDIARCIKELDKTLPWWRQLNDVRQRVLLNMCFNMGMPVLLRFNRTLNRMQAGKFDLAAKSMLESLWADQVGKRAIELAYQMEKGE